MQNPDANDALFRKLLEEVENLRREMALLKSSVPAKEQFDSLENRLKKVEKIVCTEEDQTRLIIEKRLESFEKPVSMPLVEKVLEEATLDQIKAACPACGLPADESDLYCMRCGVYLAREEITAREPAPPGISAEPVFIDDTTIQKETVFEPPPPFEQVLENVLPDEYSVEQQHLDPETPEPAIIHVEAVPDEKPTLPDDVYEQEPVFEEAEEKSREVFVETPREFDWGGVEAKAAVWGTRAGAFILVLGLGYLLSIGFSKLGIFGKAMVVYFICIGMWATGFVCEKKERYSTWGKIMLAGGWAGMYFTTFLIHYLPQARLINNPSIDVFLLSGIAAGMILHSFKYKSQALTALTYFIGFLTISLSINLAEETFFSLIATAILAVSMLFILRKMQWYYLALFSILACYGTHAIWLHPLVSIFRAAGAGHGMNFWSGLSVLVLYWVTFTAAVHLTTPRDEMQEGLSMGMAAVNFALFTLVFRYHVGSANPQLRWVFTATMASAYAILAYISLRTNRPKLFTINLVIAILCSTMTLYFKLLGGNWVAVGWLLQAEALFAAGILANQKRFRQIAIVNFILVGAWLLLKDYSDASQLSLLGVVFYKRGLSFTTTAIVLYINAVWSKGTSRSSGDEVDHSYIFSYAASALMLIILLRSWFPENTLTLAVEAGFLGLILVETGIRIKDFHFRLEGALFSFLSVIMALAPFISDDLNSYYALAAAYRIGCNVTVIALSYFAFARFQRHAEREGDDRQFEQTMSVVSIIAIPVAVMCLYSEFAHSAPAWIPAAWIALGILFIETGFALRMKMLCVHGYIITGLTLLWSLDMATGWFGWNRGGAGTAVPLWLVIGGFFYLFARVLFEQGKSDEGSADSEQSALLSGRDSIMAYLFSAAGTLILVLLLRQELKEVRPLFIAVAWLASALALLEAGIAFRSRPLRVEGFTVAMSAFLYALFHNLSLGLHLGPFSDRLITLSLCTGMLYYFHERMASGEQKKVEWIDSPDIAPAMSWLAATLLCALIYMEVWSYWPAWVGTAWLAPMLAFFYVGTQRENAHFLAQGALLATVIFIWILLVPIHFADTISSQAVMIKSQRAFSTVPVILVFYSLFYMLRKPSETVFDTFNEAYGGFIRDAFCWAASILLYAIITVEVDMVSGALTSVLWIIIAILIMKAGSMLGSSVLKTQSVLAALATFTRTLLVNCGEPWGDFLFSSGRTASVIFIAAGLFCMYFISLLSG